MVRYFVTGLVTAIAINLVVGVGTQLWRNAQVDGSDIVYWAEVGDTRRFKERLPLLVQSAEAHGAEFRAYERATLRGHFETAEVIREIMTSARPEFASELSWYKLLEASIRIDDRARIERYMALQYTNDKTSRFYFPVSTAVRAKNLELVSRFIDLSAMPERTAMEALLDAVRQESTFIKALLDILPERDWLRDKEFQNELAQQICRNNGVPMLMTCLKMRLVDTDVCLAYAMKNNCGSIIKALAEHENDPDFDERN